MFYIFYFIALYILNPVRILIQNNNSYLSKQLLEVLWDLHDRIRFVRQGLF